MRVSLKSVCALFFFISVVQASRFQPSTSITQSVESSHINTFHSLHFKNSKARAGIIASFAQLCGPFSQLDCFGSELRLKAMAVVTAAREFRENMTGIAEALNERDYLDALDAQKYFEFLVALKGFIDTYKSVSPVGFDSPDIVDTEQAINEIVKGGAEKFASDIKELVSLATSEWGDLAILEHLTGRSK